MSAGNSITALPLSRPLLRARRPLIGALCAALGALAVALVLAFAGVGGGAPSASAVPAVRAYVAPGGAFAVRLPAGWTPVSPARLSRSGATPLAALRSADGRGLVLFSTAPAVHVKASTLARRLTARLAARMPGFRAVGAHVVRLRSGSAFLYTFVHGSQVQSLTLAAAVGRAYTIDTVSSADAPAVARQAGAIVASFGPVGAAGSGS